jgi:hypothetical protein
MKENTIEKPVSFKQFAKDKKVTIRRVARSGWDSAIKYNMSRKSFVTLSCSKDFGVYNTGLTEDERKALEAVMYKKPDELNPYSSFWDKWNYKFEGTEQVLNLLSPNDYLIYKVLMQHPRVAKKEDEVTKSTELVFFDTEMDFTLKEIAMKKKDTAFTKFKSMSNEQINNAYLIQSNGMSTTDTDKAKVLLYQLLEEDVDKFLDLVGSNTFEEKAIALRAYRSGIINKVSGLFFYGEVALGKTIDEVAEFLANNVNNEIKVEIFLKLENNK